MTDTPPADKPVEINGNSDPGRWLDRPGANGKTERWWMPTLKPAPIKRDMSRSAIEHSRAKRQDRKTAKPVFEGSRQMAERLDKELQDKGEQQ